MVVILLFVTIATFLYASVKLNSFSQSKCDPLEKSLNELVGAMTNNVPGWNLDVQWGQWNNHSDSFDHWTHCGQGEFWYGWDGFQNKTLQSLHHTRGSISTVLNASGRGELTFRNCFDKGNVLFMLNDIEIARAEKNSTVVMPFHFEAGAKIELVENIGIIQFIHLDLFC